jgi:hypothetical protein
MGGYIQGLIVGAGHVGGFYAAQDRQVQVGAFDLPA